MSLPRDARNRWRWEPHLVAGVHETMPGYCAMLQPVAQDGAKVEEEDHFALVSGILEEIQPVALGLSCAIIVQANRTARDLVDYLRAHSPSRIPVMCESEIAIATDNPVTLALLSLLKTAAHPGDTMAWEHLRMTPFAVVFDRLEMNPGRLCADVLRRVFDDGFEATLRHWIGELVSSGTALDEFSLRRTEDFALAARLFDASGSRDIDEFLGYAGNYTVREPDTRNAVQIMTIHKSKGLTFDCVILPDLEGNSMRTVRRGIGVKRGEKREVEWVFDLPSSDIVKADEVLKEYREEREAEAAYEELCKFYVALTRAKYANYLITAPRSANSKSENFIKLLETTLGGKGEAPRTHFCGVEADAYFESETSATDRHWFEKLPRKALPEDAETEAPDRSVVPGETRLRPVRRTPSGSETSIVTAKQLFSRGGRFARSYGTLVHALFEQILWLDEMDTADLEKLWAAVPCPDPSIRNRALDEVRRCLAAAPARKALCRPSPAAQCWREKRFEILLKGEWLSGTFDRVILEAGSATILDFKTDKVDGAEALAERINGYRPQLQTYREVLCRMTGLAPEVIRCQLLFTHRCEVIDVEV